jgi:hypothetical protein
MDLKGTYYRWTKSEGQRANESAALTADILGTDTNVVAVPEEGLVYASVPSRGLSPNEARMIGVRLIEGATLADNGRSVRGS